MAAMAQQAGITQTQSLTMTQQMLQSLEILQLSAMDLEAAVSQAVLENPLLERQEKTGEGDAPAEYKERSDSAETPEEWEAEAVESGMADLAETHTADMFSGSSSTSYTMETDDNQPPYWETLPDRTETLEAALLRQMRLLLEDRADWLIASSLIAHIEPSGYLTISLKEIAFALGAKPAQVEEVLCVMQQCEPAGVFARNLEECLRLQLEDQGLLSDEMARLLPLLELLGRGERRAVCRRAHIDDEQLSALLAIIRRLDPKPGACYQAEAQVITPDVTVAKAPDGRWRPMLNAEAFPAVSVQADYYRSLRSKVADKEEKHYLSQHYYQAGGFRKALMQRAESIYRVAVAICVRQQAFFEQGLAGLRPMTLKDIAQEVDLHESTVSRAVNGKYIGTPRGTFEMKALFTASVRSSMENVMHSSASVKERIRQIVAEETRILSDGAIARRLQDEGMEAARRTVAKYREALDIPSSVERRRLKKLG